MSLLMSHAHLMQANTKAGKFKTDDVTETAEKWPAMPPARGML